VLVSRPSPSGASRSSTRMLSYIFGTGVLATTVNLVASLTTK
jgi:hypothetical protein